MDSVKGMIRIVHDFPVAGIPFCDIMPLLADKDGFGEVVGAMKARWDGHGVTRVAGIDARGFILAGALCRAMGLGLLPVRKKGKLPPETVSRGYALEYGQGTLEVPAGALAGGDRVLVVDDVIATGGTAAAAVGLVRDLGATVAGCSFIIDLPHLGGMGKLSSLGVETHAICAFDENQE